MVSERNVTLRSPKLELPDNACAKQFEPKETPMKKLVLAALAFALLPLASRNTAADFRGHRRK